MPKGYDLSKKAKADLRGIWNYTEDRWGEQQADTYYRNIIQSLADIAGGRRKGRRFPLRPRYFKIKQDRHLIFYMVSDDGRVFVSRILHEAMDLPSQLDDA